MKDEFDYKDRLTNEELLKRFNSQFDLVRYAIQLAENAIRSGREPDEPHSQNMAFQILSEIASHKDRFDDTSCESCAEEEVQEEKKERKSKSKAVR